MMPQAIAETTHWLDHPYAKQVCALEYALVQGYTEGTKENWDIIDALRNEIDKDITPSSAT